MKKNRLKLEIKSESLPPRSLGSSPLQLRCAWCQTAMTLPKQADLPKEASLSHGICTRCVGRFFSGFPPLDESS